jgi:hypothetical protein
MIYHCRPSIQLPIEFEFEVKETIDPFVQFAFGFSKFADCNEL